MEVKLTTERETVCIWQREREREGVCVWQRERGWGMNEEEFEEAGNRNLDPFTSSRRVKPKALRPANTKLA